MKIVKEQLNEIKRGVSGLGAIGVGHANIIGQIKQWCKNNGIDDYTINDNDELVLRHQSDYVITRKKDLPPFIKIKVKPGATAFILAMAAKDYRMVNKLLDDYLKLNIQHPDKYKQFIKDLEKRNYVCVSMPLQFKHNTITFIDNELNKIIAVYFYSSRAVIRRYDVSWSAISPQILKILNNVTIEDYSPILDWLNMYRYKQKKKLLL